MTRPILVITRRLPEAVEARAARDYIVRLNAADRRLAPEEIVSECAGAAALLCTPGERIDRALIESLPESLRVIGTYSVGLEHIDLAAAARRRIPVVHTPGVLSRATAEIAMLLILAAARRAGEAERFLRGGAWTGWRSTLLLGMEVSGKRLGIFGMGRIGRTLAGMARGFGMEIHYRNRHRLDPRLEAGAIYHAADETFLPLCDVLSLNAPATEATQHWLNAARLALLPPRAVVVNTARGSLVDDAALVAALQSGAIFAAGLDVYPQEPSVPSPYLDLENVVLLPHIGSATVETRDAMGFLVLDGIDAALAGGTPPGLAEPPPAEAWPE